MSAEPTSRHLFEWEDASGVAVVRFTTNVLREERVIRLLFEQVEQLVESGRNKIVFNFAGIQAFASYAIGRMIALNAKLSPPNGRFALCGPDADHRGDHRHHVAAKAVQHLQDRARGHRVLRLTRKVDHERQDQALTTDHTDNTDQNRRQKPFFASA